MEARLFQGNSTHYNAAFALVLGKGCPFKTERLSRDLAYKKNICLLLQSMVSSGSWYLYQAECSVAPSALAQN